MENECNGKCPWKDKSEEQTEGKQLRPEHLLG